MRWPTTWNGNGSQGLVSRTELQGWLHKQGERLAALNRRTCSPPLANQDLDTARRLRGIASALNAIADEHAPPRRIDWSKIGPR